MLVSASTGVKAANFIWLPNKRDAFKSALHVESYQHGLFAASFTLCPLDGTSTLVETMPSRVMLALTNLEFSSVSAES
ncbi:unnamed protein product [Toxocara canis]|uniref:Ig-like domain-containing protein n=1 Tax=Toxocara canis TaxID=6265 RepID=A0A183TXE0_TOXCA|nr:unnamed protein product [Toxocara canis]